MTEKQIESLGIISTILVFLWLVSFIIWIILTFFVKSILGMWISLGFMWLFLIAKKLLRTITKRVILNGGLIKNNKKEKNKKLSLTDYKKENVSYQK